MKSLLHLQLDGSQLQSTAKSIYVHSKAVHKIQIRVQMAVQ